MITGDYKKIKFWFHIKTGTAQISLDGNGKVITDYSQLFTEFTTFTIMQSVNPNWQKI